MSGHIFLPTAPAATTTTSPPTPASCGATGISIDVAAATVKGRRNTNADAWAIDEEAGFFAVADGVGDTPRSGVVARMALEAVGEMFLAPWALLPPAERWAGEAAERLRLGVVQANGRLYVEGRAERLGTTFAGVVVCANYLCVGSVGDSRVYLFRPTAARIARLTQDDTVLGQSLWRGVPYDVAAAMPDAHALTQAIGTKPSVEMHPLALRWAPGDVAVVCTDGLTDHLDDATIARVLLEHGDLGTAAQHLIERAAGSGDNATAVLARRAQ